MQIQHDIFTFEANNEDVTLSFPTYNKYYIEKLIKIENNEKLIELITDNIIFIKLNQNIMFLVNYVSQLINDIDFKNEKNNISISDIENELPNNDFYHFNEDNILELDSKINFKFKNINNIAIIYSILDSYKLLETDKFNEILENKIETIINYTNSKNKYNIYKHKNEYLFRYLENINDKWDFIFSLIKKSIKSDRVDTIFEPRPKYIKTFKSDNYSNLYSQLNKFNELFNRLFINSNDDIIYLLDSFLYTYSFIIYDILLISMSNFNIFNLEKLNSYSIIKKENNIKIYRVKTNDLEISQKFEKAEKTDTFIYGFHGSPATNWYSILFNGLYVPDGHKIKIANGAAYGTGIYISDDSNFSLGYSSKYRDEECIIGVFQILGGIKQFKKNSNIYVIPKNEYLTLKYLIIGSFNDISKNNVNLNQYFIKNDFMSSSSSKSFIDQLPKRSTSRLYKEIANLHKKSGIFDESSKLIFHFEIRDDSKFNNLTFKLPIVNFKDEDIEKYNNQIEIENKELIKKGLRTKQYKYDLYYECKKRNIENIVLHLEIPDDYPFKPPFAYLETPRFAYLTGHITLGGSVCMELLLNQGWIASVQIEAILKMFILNVKSGDGKLDESRYNVPYTISEAKSAHTRAIQNHREWFK